MKRRNLQTLKLNKSTVSTFKLEKVKGGITPIETWMYSEIFPCKEEKKEKEQPAQPAEQN